MRDHEIRPALCDLSENVEAERGQIKIGLKDIRRIRSLTGTVLEKIMTNCASVVPLSSFVGCDCSETWRARDEKNCKDRKTTQSLSNHFRHQRL